MFERIKEGAEEYRLALVQFQISAESMGLTEAFWKPNRKKMWSQAEWLPWDPSKEPHGLPSRDHEEITRQNTQLRGMEIALGLTPAEIRKAYRHAGLRVVRVKKDVD
jgi:hypothetical protein